MLQHFIRKNEKVLFLIGYSWMKWGFKKKFEWLINTGPLFLPFIFMRGKSSGPFFQFTKAVRGKAWKTDQGNSFFNLNLFVNRVFLLDGFFREEWVMDFDENTTSLTCPKDKLELVFLAMFASELVGSRKSSLLVQFSW